MPCRSTHLLLGLGGSLALEAKRSGPPDNLGAVRVIWSGIGSMLPDVIEPAKSPRHRKFFHSVTFAAIVIFGVWRIRAALGKEQGQWGAALEGLSGGYLNHLLADACTKFSLPLC